MAQGDVTVFNKAMEWMADGTHDLDSASYYCAIIDDSTTPSAASVAPVLGNFGDVTSAGSYTAGGEYLGAVTWAESGGTTTFDSPAVDPTWASNGSNATDARWGLIYRTGSHGGQTDPCLCYIDLGTTVNMSTGDLTITWAGSGIFTLASA